MKTLNKYDFAGMFGTSPASFDKNTLHLIESLNFRFREIQGDELEFLILNQLKRIDIDNQIVGAPERKEKWENGWQENLDEFIGSGYDIRSLVPKFIRSNQPVRLKQAYIYPEDPNFELNFVSVLRSWFAHEYFSTVEHVYEFGCGTGFNLLGMAEFFPEKFFYGSDFAKSSVTLVNTIASIENIKLSAQIFDMKSPDCSYKIRSNSGVFTFGSMEQLAGEIDAFIEYCISENPKVCVHIEPADELYDLNNLSDYLAYKFQTKRKYTSGICGKLKELEIQGIIEILKIKRLYFGSMNMEGYNLFVWKRKGV